MAHDSSNNTIYINTQTTPHQGVCIADLQAVLRSDRNDIGGIITTADINKWPKFKPVRSSLLKVMTLADMQDVYFGLDVPIYGSGYITNIFDFLDAFSSAYAYLKPRGADRSPKEWFRFRDFDGYNRNAQPFVNESGCTFPHMYEYGGAGSVGCNFTLSLNNTSSNLRDGIAISDWKLGGSSGTAFSAFYFGLIFKHGTDTPKIVTATSTVLSTGGMTLTMTDSGDDGLDGLNSSYTYMVYPVLCSNSHSSLGSVGNLDMIVPLPVATFQFSQYPASSRVTYDVIFADAYQGARARLVVTATIGIRSTGGYQSISTNHLQLYRASSDTDMSGSLIGSYNIGTITTNDPVTWEPTPLEIDQFPSYVRIHLYNESVSGMTLDYWVLVREDEF